MPDEPEKPVEGPTEVMRRRNGSLIGSHTDSLHRFDEMIDMVAAGHTTIHLRKYLQEKHHYTYDGAITLLRRFNTWVQKMTKKDREKHRADQIVIMYNIVLNCIEQHRYGTACTAVRNLMKLTGTEMPMEINVDKEVKITIRDYTSGNVIDVSKRENFSQECPQEISEMAESLMDQNLVEGGKDSDVPD